MEENTNINSEFEYGSDAIKTLDWKEHIRRRPGMYIGKLGDGSHADDGIYVLLKEVLDNALDEHMMGFGKQIVVEISSEVVSVRDYGRGIPLPLLFQLLSIGIVSVLFLVCLLFSQHRTLSVCILLQILCGTYNSTLCVLNCSWCYFVLSF